MDTTEKLKDSHYYIDKDKDGLWIWYLLSGDNRKIATSANPYRNLDECKADIGFVKMTKGIEIQVLEPSPTLHLGARLVRAYTCPLYSL
jgi:hypothetical protein